MRIDLFVSRLKVTFPHNMLAITNSAGPKYVSSSRHVTFFFT